MAKTLKTKAKSVKKPVASKTAVNTKKKPAPVAVKVKAVVKAKAIATPQKKKISKQAEVPVKKAKEQKIVTAPALAQEPVAAVKAPVVVKKIEKLDFIAGDFVVYPAHGVGLVEGVETQMIAGMEITLYTICFEKDRMRLKLPVSKVKASGLRKLSSKDRLKDALATLQGRSQIRRIMWSRRAQEYETKINSGDPVSIAEVLRDLRKADDQSEQSYSERQIYQAALERLAREVAAIEKIDEKKAAEKLEAVLTNVA